MSEPRPAPPFAGEPLAATAALDTIPFAVLIDEAWRSTRAWARAILLPAAAMLAPGVLAMHVGLGLWNLSMVGLGGAGFDFGAFCGTFAIWIVGMLLVSLYLLAVYGCVMVATVRAVGGESPALGPCLRFYLRPRVWGTDLLAWLLMGLGFIACFLPGLFLMAAWALRRAVMVREGLFGWPALTRSWQLLAHNPSGRVLRHPVLKVLLLFLLSMVLAYAVSLLVQMPAAIASQLMMVRSMSRGEQVDPQALVRATLWMTIPAGVIASLAQLAVTLYVDFATSHLYYDQVRRKEGADLSSALDRLLGSGAPPSPPAPALGAAPPGAGPPGAGPASGEPPPGPV
jgi:hypothetical protein